MRERVCIVGSGNWGSTVAKIIGRNVLKLANGFHPQVNLWVHEEVVKKDGKDINLSDYINKYHENCKYLPEIQLPDNVVAIPSVKEAVENCTLLVFVLPHQFVERVCRELSIGGGGVRAISLVKGVGDNFQFVSSQIANLLNCDVSVLMGANIANEVAKEQFCEATIGYNIRENGEIWSRLFHTDYFRIRTVADVKGVELCGALKNIVALSAGLVDGLGLGDNTKAAIIRIGLDEMRRLSAALHKDICTETFFESCGVADLITTCFGGRNRKIAQAFVERKRFGNNPATIPQLEEELLNGQKLQGPPALIEVVKIIRELDIESQFPLFLTTFRILYENLDPVRIVKDI